MSTTEDMGALFGPAEGAPALDAVAAAARTYLRLRREVEEADARLGAAKKAKDQAERALLDRMAEAGVPSIKVDMDGHRPSLSACTSVYYALPSGSLEDASVMAWLFRAGGHDLVRRTVHPMSLSAFCRELAAAGRPLHPAVRATERRLVRVTGN